MVKIKADTYLAFQRATNPKMAEKDYLECLVLEKLFQDEYVSKNLVFAGGASVTKAYNISNRIGQDIDLACSDFKDIPDNRSKKKLNTFRRDFKDYVFEVIRPAINNIINQDSQFMILTDRDWHALENKEHFMSSPTLHLLYNSKCGPEMGHLCIEIIPRKYMPDAIQYRSVVPYSVGKPMGNIPTVAYEQTFWDKVYALHSNALSSAPHFDEGFSRHYYDVATLAHYVDLDKTYHMFSDIEAHQKKYTTKDLPDVKSPSDIILLPDGKTLHGLDTDYQSIGNAFNATRESWTEIVQMLIALSHRLKNIQGGR